MPFVHPVRRPRADRAVPLATPSRWALVGATGLVLAALAAPGPAHGNDAPARPATAPKAEKVDKAEKPDKPDKPGAAAGATATLPPGKDPLDHLRERLADKLGAAPAGPSAQAGGRPGRKAAGGAPPVVSVVNKGTPSEAVPAARPAARVVTNAAQVHAAHGTAAHGTTASTTLAAPGLAAPAPSGGLAANGPLLAAVGSGVGLGAGLPAHSAVHSTLGAAAPLAAVPRELLPPAAPEGHEGAAHWAYEGATGPAAWGRLKPEFATCANGKRQSPIDIREGMKLELEPVQFTYLPSAVRVIDNGHTVQVNVAGGNFIEVMGRRYELLQFHFHRPSEERIDGRQFDMVAHLVHRDPEGRLAVIAVLLGRGSAQPLIQTVWNNLPLEKGEEQSVRPLLDLSALLPTDRSYYTYMGSLTTPPCTEGVLWMVMKTPVSVSPEQIAIFSRLYPMNARPVQALAGRLIKESN